MVLYSEEIKLGLKVGYKYDFIDGYKYKKAPLMKEFM